MDGNHRESQFLVFSSIASLFWYFLIAFHFYLINVFSKRTSNMIIISHWLQTSRQVKMFSITSYYLCITAARNRTGTQFGS